MYTLQCCENFRRVCECVRVPKQWQATPLHAGFQQALISLLFSSFLPLFLTLLTCRNRLKITFLSQCTCNMQPVCQKESGASHSPIYFRTPAESRSQDWRFQRASSSVFSCVCVCVRACVCVGRFSGDLSGPGCLSIRAGAIRPSESGSIPSCHGDKIKAFRQAKRSLPCALAHNVPPFKHPVSMEMQLWPFKSFLGPAVSLGHWHTCTQTHNASTCHLINIYTCTLLSRVLLLSLTHPLTHTNTKTHVLLCGYLAHVGSRLLGQWDGDWVTAGLRDDTVRQSGAGWVSMRFDRI